MTRELLQQALAYVRWEAFGQCRTPGWEGPPPTASEVSAALEAALAPKPLKGADWTITMRRMLVAGKCSRRECHCALENAEHCIWYDEPDDAPKPCAALEQPVQSAATREAFEAWVSDNGQSPKAIERNPFGDYKLMQTNTLWMGCAFGMREEREACAKFMDDCGEFEHAATIRARSNYE